MCSILLTNKHIPNLDFVNFHLKFRGPDVTSMVHMQGLTFVHNLLSISGSLTTQPFVTADVVSMHNGEIYNYGDHDSDGYMLIPAYQSLGDTFTRSFDGEFAVVLVDFAAQKVIMSTDVFRTKPLWIAHEGTQFGVCTYRSALERLGFMNITKVPANTIMCWDLCAHELRTVGTVYDWDLHQHKTVFTDWHKAFELSIRKRTQRVRERMFIGLSSGYDSGAIACELRKQRVPFTAFTVMGKENAQVLSQRTTPDHVWITPTEQLWNQAHSHLRQTVEPYKYTICSSSSDYNEFWLDLHDDSGSNGLSMVCAQAQERNIKIYLSGQGADELFSDYGHGGHKIYPHSNFGGLFPQDLNTMFPWNSFYGSSMESYLAKEEFVAGAYGIEARYPFLDTQVVQEFLWLTPELKNATYKSVLYDYLTTNAYPFVPNQKIGF
jgi:asparagine synthetase B (glutamine-hydrolysing)